jgi:hypothetical protein
MSWIDPCNYDSCAQPRQNVTMVWLTTARFLIHPGC